jgi:hypothetical protein
MYKALICLAVLVAVTALGTSAFAQAQATPIIDQAQANPVKSRAQATPIEQLVRMACRTGELREITVNIETGYMVMLGISPDMIHSARYLKAASPEGGRELIIPVEECQEPRSEKPESFFVLMNHFFTNTNNLHEGYYYRADVDAHLVSAAHFLEGRSKLYALAPLIRLRQADFEAEQAIWFNLEKELKSKRAEQ